jgi:hypothetical protein
MEVEVRSFKIGRLKNTGTYKNVTSYFITERWCQVIYFTSMDSKRVTGYRYQDEVKGTGIENVLPDPISNI